MGEKMYEVWSQVVDSFKKVTIWGTLPIFFVFIVTLLTIITIVFRKHIESPLEEFRAKNKFYKKEELYSNVDYFSEIYILVCITLAILPILALFNARYGVYICEMLDKIDVISNIVIGFTSIAVTMAVVIVLFDKRYYIVFSIQEVLQRYKFTECLTVVICSCVVVSVSTMTLLNGKIDSYFDVARFMILEISTLYNIIGVMYIFYVIINVMFLDKKRELRLLGQLYRRFWLQRIDTVHFKAKDSWSNEAVTINLDYLIESYIDASKYKEIINIKEIEFVTTFGIYKNKWYAKARNKFLTRILLLFFVSVIINILILQEKCRELVFLNIIVTISAIVCSNLNFKSVNFVIMRLFSDTWGYYIYNQDNSEKFYPRVAARKGNAVDKYIMRMNSLNAFFYIWLNYAKYKKKHIAEQFGKVVQRIQIIENQNMISYFPVFTIGYFLFNKGIKVDIIKELFKKIVTESERVSFEKMLFSQIFYLTKNSYQDILEYNQKINEYMIWIKEL